MVFRGMVGDPPGRVDAAVEYAVRNPEQVSVGVVLSVLVAALAYAVLRQRRAVEERFVHTLAAHEAITVLMHPNPDPDAMASAVAVKHLAESRGVDATLQYPGQIRHEENRVFRSVLDLDLDRIEGMGNLATETVVLVDHNEPRGFTGAGSLRPVAVVDHHPGEGVGTEFTDLRPRYGACATVLAEYLSSLGYATGTDEGLPTEIATGLLYGIYSDTDRLIRGATPAEFSAGAYLRPGVDDGLLDCIADPRMDAAVLDVKARAVLERQTDGPYVVSDVGTVENVDAIPQAADYLLQLEGTTAVVVFGDRDGTLHLSGRSRDERVHMGRVLQAVVENLSMAEAGGHARMGGGQVSLDHLSGIGPGDGVSRAELGQELFDAMAGNIRRSD